MAFEAARQGYRQISPTFLPGYPYPDRYHNLGQLQTPYEGKKFGQSGDYGPPQDTEYYNVWNPNYPYVLDKDFRASSFIPGNESCFPGQPGYSPCYNHQYPEEYIPGNYFEQKSVWPTPVHAPPPVQYGGLPNPKGLEDRPLIKNLVRIEEFDAPQGRYDAQQRGYDAPQGNNTQIERYGSSNPSPVNYKNLATAGNSLKYSKDFPPFDNYY